MNKTQEKIAEALKKYTCGSSQFGYYIIYEVIEEIAKILEEEGKKLRLTYNKPFNRTQFERKAGLSVVPEEQSSSKNLKKAGVQE